MRTKQDILREYNAKLYDKEDKKLYRFSMLELLADIRDELGQIRKTIKESEPTSITINRTERSKP